MYVRIRSTTTGGERKIKQKKVVSLKVERKIFLHRQRKVSKNCSRNNGTVEAMLCCYCREKLLIDIEATFITCQEICGGSKNWNILCFSKSLQLMSKLEESFVVVWKWSKPFPDFGRQFGLRLKFSLFLIWFLTIRYKRYSILMFRLFFSFFPDHIKICYLPITGIELQQTWFEAASGYRSGSIHGIGRSSNGREKGKRIHKKSGTRIGEKFAVHACLVEYNKTLYFHSKPEL